MTQTCLNTHILYTRGLFVTLYDTYLTKLNIGRKCTEAELNMLIVEEYLDYFCKYQPFEQTVTYATSFTITREGENNVIISITVNTTDIITTITYTGDGDLNEILTYFEAQFLANTDFTFQVYVSEDILYIYSYDVNLNFGDITSVSSSDDDEATIEFTNIQNTYCTLLDQWNCLTTEQLCDALCFSKSLLTDCNCN